MSACQRSARGSIIFPQLYTVGQRDALFNAKIFFSWLADGKASCAFVLVADDTHPLLGIYESLVLFFIPFGFFYAGLGQQADGRMDGARLWARAACVRARDFVLLFAPRS